MVLEESNGVQKTNGYLHLYYFVPATMKDFDDILYLLLNHFIQLEPHARALRLQAEDCKDYMEYMVHKTLRNPYSYVVREKATGRLVAVRLMTFGNRDAKLNYEPYAFDFSKLSSKFLQKSSIVSKVKSSIWEVLPGVNKVLRREISCVIGDHQRRGIAKHLLFIGIDFAALKTMDVEGISSEAVSLANQTLLSKNGFDMLLMHRDPKHHPECDDGTQGVALFFHRI